MKKAVSLICLLSFCYTTQAQNKWFQTYTDSVALYTDANTIAASFIKDIRAIKADVKFTPKTIVHSTPFLVYYDPGDTSVNISFWNNVPDGLKQFINTVSGSETEGTTMFGFFFNGFYLPHELGHWFQDCVGKAGLAGSYDNEHLANTIAMLWWKKQGKQKELKACYDWTKKIFPQLKNPVPEGQTIQEYFTKNYEAATNDPFVYAYMQFGQFIQIYEDKTLPDFDGFIKDFLKKQ